MQKSKKAQSHFVSFILATLITVIGASLAAFLLMPAIERAKVSGALQDAINQLNAIDALVQQVASEGVGSQRQYVLHVTKGQYQVNNTTGSFEWQLATKYSPIPAGTTAIKGNLQLSTSTAGAEAYDQNVQTILRVALQYPNITLIGNEIFPAGSYTICIKKVAEDLAYKLTYVSIRSC